MRTFNLIRKEDVSGVSGVGRIAEGVQFHDGQVVMSWFGQHHTLEIAPDIKSVEAIHGHEGKTRVVWDDEAKDWPKGEAVLRFLDGVKKGINYVEEAILLPETD